MKKKLNILFLMFIINGCSVYSAATAPSPVEYELVKKGISRDDVVDILGPPSYQQFPLNS